MRMGLGLGLNKQSGKGASSSPENTIKAAIKCKPGTKKWIESHFG